MQVDLAIVAHGVAYQRAAALSAATFARRGRLGGAVTIWLPADEPLDAEAEATASTWGVSLRRLQSEAPPADRAKPTATLKCGAWLEIVGALTCEAVLLVDADTACLRALPTASLGLKDHLAGGGVAAARDRRDHTPRGPDDRWAHAGRFPYVNSGVLLAGRAALCLLERCVDLAHDPALHDGPYADQRVLNHALATAPELLRLLPWSWNAIRWRAGWPARIVHDAGGAGALEGARRQRRHAERCSRLLR